MARGTRPIPIDCSLTELRVGLTRLGYAPHRNLRLRRENELFALRKLFSNGRRQVHVQVCSDPRAYHGYLLYAHTESVTEDLIGHALDLVSRSYSYPAGARMLRADLKQAGLL